MNIQGDIISIYDATNVELCRYIYDAWGNHKTYVKNGTSFVDISIETEYNLLKDSLELELAENNPFRYRGYYYDKETGLYYLNSRYYDPAIGRFINADDLKFLYPEIMNGLNLYCYCLNNPIYNSDSNGTFVDTMSEVVDFISALLETGINLGIASVGWAVKTGVRPNNIGIGVFLKNQAKELSSLSNISRIFSKISTMIAIVSTIMSVGEAIISDINSGYSTSRIVSNAVTNSLIYGGITLSAGFVGSKIGALFGSAIPGLGTAIGAAVGFIAGLTFGWILDIQINGKSIIQHIRDGIYNFWRWLFG